MSFIESENKNKFLDEFLHEILLINNLKPID